MKAYIVKKYVLVHDWAPHPVNSYDGQYSVDCAVQNSRFFPRDGVAIVVARGIFSPPCAGRYLRAKCFHVLLRMLAYWATGDDQIDYCIENASGSKFVEIFGASIMIFELEAFEFLYY